jgi:hypothetical protein
MSRSGLGKFGGVGWREGRTGGTDLSTRAYYYYLQAPHLGEEQLLQADSTIRFVIIEAQLSKLLTLFFLRGFGYQMA